MARITLQQAIQIAESAINTQAYRAEQEREDKGLVYNQDMCIDAGNGGVLYTDEGRKEDHSSRPRSRVQMTQL